MSNKVITLINTNPWVVNNRNVYQVQGISANASNQTTTAYFNIWANGISSVDGVDRLYRTSGSRNYLVTDISGNLYDNPIQLNEKTVIAVNNRHAVLAPPEEPLPPVELPPCTFRMQFSNTAYNPTTVTGWKSGSTWTKVTGTDLNQWDYTHVTANWNDEFLGKFSATNNFVDILYAGDFSSVTSMGNNHGTAKVSGGTFGSSGAGKTSYLRSICEFDTSNIVNMEGMFFHCGSLTKVPKLNTSACSSFWSMFDTCISLKWVNGLDFRSAKHVRAIFANCALSILPDISTLSLANITTACSAAYAFQANSMVGEFGSPGISASYSYLSAYTKYFTGAYKGTGSAISAREPQVAAELAVIPGSWK